MEANVVLKMEANTQDYPSEPATTTSRAMDGLAIPEKEQQLAGLEEELRITKTKLVERDALIAEAEEKAKLDDAILEATAGLLQAQARLLHETRENVESFLRLINTHRPRNIHEGRGEDTQVIMDREGVSHDEEMPDTQPTTGPTWAEIQTQAARLSEWTAILREAVEHRRFPLKYYAWLDKYGFKYDEFETGQGSHSLRV